MQTSLFNNTDFTNFWMHTQNFVNIHNLIMKIDSNVNQDPLLRI